MGKSAKFYKRPSKKEKEGLAVKKLVDPSAITKNKRHGGKMAVLEGGQAIKVVSPSMFEKKKAAAAAAPAATEDDDVNMMEEDAPVVSKKEAKAAAREGKELPDYVDLFSGKKTYKKIPKKRK